MRVGAYTARMKQQPTVTLRPRGMGVRRWAMALVIMAMPVLACGLGVGLVADGYNIRCHNVTGGFEIQVANWTSDAMFSIPIPASHCP